MIYKKDLYLETKNYILLYNKIVLKDHVMYLDTWY